MPWADDDTTTSAKLHELAELTRQTLARAGASADEIAHENGGAASEGFIDGCDTYDAFMFTATLDGRTYCVTVEDVTVGSEDDDVDEDEETDA